MNGKRRQRLEERRRELQRRLETIRQGSVNLSDSAGELSVADNHPADMASDVMERGQMIGEAVTIRSRLHAVDDAVDRLKEGTYGRCSVCGNVIDDQRLQAVPEADSCAHCAEDNVQFAQPEEGEVLADTARKMRTSEQGDSGIHISSLLEHWGSAAGPGHESSD